MADNKENESQDGGLLDRIKESPRTVSALIIILIVAAAIYAFSGDQTPLGTTGGPETQSTPTASFVPEIDGESGTVPGSDSAADMKDKTTTPTPKQVLPEPRAEGEAYVEVAQAGNGVTHLARRAADRWLLQNNAGYTVSNEHRIYIEDYIKDQLGSKPLNLGAEVSIPFEMIAAAVKAAGTLNERQLQNLTPYASAVFS